MFRVLVIDDESLIARGLQEKINWESLDCEVCGVAFDGIEGKRLFDELKPDIVITDIVMPGLNGIELAGYIHSVSPGKPVVILTAYEDFSYAQKAIKYGVVDYILKPIDKNAIICAIKKTVRGLKNKMSSVDEISRLQTAMAEVKPIITKALLFDIALHGVEAVDEAMERQEYFSVAAGRGSVIAFGMDYDKETPITKLQEFSVKNIIRNTLEQKRQAFEMKELEGKFIVITRHDSTVPLDIVSKRDMEAAEEVIQNVEEMTGVRVSAGMGKSFLNLQEINKSYVDALEALRFRFFSDKNGVFRLQKDLVQNKEEVPMLDLSQIYKHISLGDTEAALTAFKAVLVNVVREGKEHRVKFVCAEILRNLNEIVYEKCGFLFQSFQPQEVDPIPTVKQLAEFMNTKIADACKEVEKSTANSGSNIIQKASIIIREQYWDDTLSLQWVADKLGVSSSYLSRLFKKEKNINFVDYLTEVRIDKAKELLLNTDLKNHEIAQRVGFYDVRYFGQVFRRKCGIAPGDYKSFCSKTKI